MVPHQPQTDSTSSLFKRRAAEGRGLPPGGGRGVQEEAASVPGGPRGAGDLRGPPGTSGDLRGHPPRPVGRGPGQGAPVAGGPEAQEVEGLVHGAHGAAAGRLPGRGGLGGPLVPGHLPLRRAAGGGLEAESRRTSGERRRGPEPAGQRHAVAAAQRLQREEHRDGGQQLVWQTLLPPCGRVVRSSVRGGVCSSRYIKLE